MPSQNFSKETMQKLNMAAFGNATGPTGRQVFLDCSVSELNTIFPNPADLHKQLSEAALQCKAADFEAMLKKFVDNEAAIVALIDGFERDVKYTANAPSDGWGSNGDAQYLQKKREALQRIAAKIAKKQRERANQVDPY
ncbi:MAG: hypothetical protein AB7G06_06010 [Bdellovibrionales bacterium]